MLPGLFLCSHPRELFHRPTVVSRSRCGGLHEGRDVRCRRGPTHRGVRIGAPVDVVRGPLRRRIASASRGAVGTALRDVRRNRGPVRREPRARAPMARAIDAGGAERTPAAAVVPHPASQAEAARRAAVSHVLPERPARTCLPAAFSRCRRGTASGRARSRSTTAPSPSAGRGRRDRLTAPSRPIGSIATTGRRISSTTTLPDPTTCFCRAAVIRRRGAVFRDEPASGYQRFKNTFDALTEISL